MKTVGFSKTSIRGWISCSSCKKKRSFHTKTKRAYTAKTRNQMKEFLDDHHWVCGESLIPPHGYDKLRKSAIYTNEILDCTCKVQAQYYSLKVGPLVCSSCFDPLGPASVARYNKLLETNRSVLPCCESLVCQGYAPTYKDGWVLRSQPKKRKASQDLPNPAQPPPQP